MRCVHMTRPKSSREVMTMAESTLILHVDSPDAPEIGTVAEILKNGGTAAIPTETVYGLAANALSAEAAAKIFVAKGRPADNPLIVHISDISQMGDIVSEIPENAKKLAESFWPGPLTIILPKQPHIPDVVTAGLDTVAVRMPSHPIAHALIEQAGIPLAAPSANRSGRPSPTSWRHCVEDLDGRVDAILCADDSDIGVESTVITLATPVPKVLRPGGITVEQLRSVLVEVEVDSAVLNELAPDAVAASPGMKYKHYAPKASVIIVDADTNAYIDFVNSKADEGAFALCFEEDVPHINIPCVVCGTAEDESTYAHALFTALRELDEKGAVTAYARKPSSDGVGLAVYNRLLRAAAFNIIKP